VRFRDTWPRAVLPALLVGLLGAIVVQCTAGGQGMTPTASVSATARPITFAGATLAVPAGWQVYRYDVLSSFFSLEAFITPETVPDPCTRTSNSSSCSSWPRITLPAGGIFVSLWHKGGPPGNVPDVISGDPITVAGQPGRIARIDPEEGCSAMGGDGELRVIVPSSAIWNWDELDACLRGPDHAANEAIIRDMVAKLTPNGTAIPMDTTATYPNDTGYVVSPGKLRLRTLTLTFPSAWQAVREPDPLLDRGLFAMAMGPAPIPACSNWTTCGVWPPMQLPPNGLVLAIWVRSAENWSVDAEPGETVKVGDRTARLVKRPADQECGAIGGEVLLTAVVDDDLGTSGSYDELDACLRGPDVRASEGVFRAMLASAVPSATWTG
jgi:hypothetical protein